MPERQMAAVPDSQFIPAFDLLAQRTDHQVDVKAKPYDKPCVVAHAGTFRRNANCRKRLSSDIICCSPMDQWSVRTGFATAWLAPDRPQCGGLAPTAERTMDPARIFTESLTPRPELENSQGQTRPLGDVSSMSALPQISRHRPARSEGPTR